VCRNRASSFSFCFFYCTAKLNGESGKGRKRGKKRKEKRGNRAPLHSRKGEKTSCLHQALALELHGKILSAATYVNPNPLDREETDQG